MLNALLNTASSQRPSNHFHALDCFLQWFHQFPVAVLSPTSWLSAPVLLAFGSAVAIVAFVAILIVRARIQREARAMRVQVAEEIALRQRAEAANQAKAEFLASISHEVRNPMNAIIGFMELAFQTQLNAELLEQLQTVRTSTKWLMQIVNHVVEFSKIEAGSLQLEDVSFELADAIQSAIQIVQPEATMKKLTIRCKIDHKIPLTLRGDPARLCQVVLNLLENAVQYTTSGGVILTAELESESAEGVLVRVCVMDTGIGIPLERQQQIFEPFSNQSDSWARNLAGVGLGLALTRRIVELMGGAIEVKSQLGAGSTFQFTARFQRGGRPETPERQTGEHLHHAKKPGNGRDAVDLVAVIAANQTKLEPVCAA